MNDSPKILVLSRNYPNSVLLHQGLWVQRQTHALARRGCEITVVAPSPYWPPLPGPATFAHHRQVERSRRDGTVEVLHPRFVVGPGSTTYPLEGASIYAAVRGLARRLHVRGPFDLIHAHFSYPDGVAAVALGRLLRLPVVITEHVLWKPWLETRPFVRRQAVWAAGRAAARVAVSDATRATMHSFLPERPSIDVIPVGVDGDVFHVKESRAEWPDDRILFVGWVNYVKGVDVLIDSMAVLVRRRPRVRLTVVGGALFRDKQRQEDELLRRVRAGGFNSHVVFAGPQTAEGVARFMRESDVLVLPSRRESCGAVLLEALACGTPVVATRCGGPEEIVTEEVGVLTDVEGPAALADAIERVLDRRHVYDPSRLREYVLARYSWNRLADAYLDVYRAVLRNRHRSCRA